MAATNFGLLFTSFLLLVQHFVSDEPRRGDPIDWYATTGLKFQLIVYSAGGLIAICFGTYKLLTAKSFPFMDLAIFVWAFSVWLFVVLSECLRHGLARQLSKWRGEKWIKEMDYIYLGLAASGIVIAINRLETTTDRMTFPDAFGPMLLAMALVVRALKTRADIGGWNKEGGLPHRTLADLFWRSYNKPLDPPLT